MAFGSEAGTVATGNTHKFTGHIKDDATGQYYAKARYFTTGLGRWSQPEPLLKGVPDIKFLYNPQMLNPYVYCLNNPLKYVDPDGMKVSVVGSKMQARVVQLYLRSETFRNIYDAARRNNKAEVLLRNMYAAEQKKFGSAPGISYFNDVIDGKKQIYSLIKPSSGLSTIGHEFAHNLEMAKPNIQTPKDYENYIAKNGRTTDDPNVNDCTWEAKEIEDKILEELIDNPKIDEKSIPKETSDEILQPTIE